MSFTRQSRCIRSRLATSHQTLFSDFPGSRLQYFNKPPRQGRKVGDDTDATAFEEYFENHPGAIDLWLAGHTHTHPDDRYGNKSHIEQRWGVTFANVAALTRHHGAKKRPLFPMSRLLTFVQGSREVRIQCYLHTTDYAAQGWYPPADRTVTLRMPFRP